MLMKEMEKLKNSDDAKETNAIVRKIVKNASPEIKELLIKDFKECIKNCKKGNLPDNSIYVIQMLIVFKELNMKEAFDLIVEYLKLDYEIIDMELAEVLHELLYEITSSLGEDRADDIEGIIKDKSINTFVRASFSTAFAFLAYQGKIEREYAKNFYEKFLLDKKEDINLRYLMTSDIEMLGLKELKELIIKVEAQYDNLPPWEIEDPVFDSSRFDDAIETGEFLENLDYFEAFDEAFDQFLEEEGINEDEFMNQLREFGELNDLYDMDYQEPRLSMKIGRNDLCSCGSGKKYKKCCGK